MLSKNAGGIFPDFSDFCEKSPEGNSYILVIFEHTRRRELIQRGGRAQLAYASCRKCMFLNFHWQHPLSILWSFISINNQQHQNVLVNQAKQQFYRPTYHIWACHDLKKWFRESDQNFKSVQYLQPFEKFGFLSAIVSSVAPKR